jgi:hypothetical protein
MAQDKQTAEASEDGDFLPEPPAPVEVVVEVEVEESGDALAEGIAALQTQSVDPSEVSRQLEDLTGVVLSSAEVSTRSAEVAANISHEMREVMKIVTTANDRNILHSRVIPIGLLAFLMIAVGTFFAISTRLQQNIRQLDALSLAVGKRVVELDATLATFGDATRGLGDTTEKLDSMEERQIKLNETLEVKLEDMGKLFTKLPEQISGQVNGQSEKALDAKLLAINKSIQALEAKVQALANKPAPAAPAAPNNQKEVLAEIQKLKKDLDAANANAAKAAKEAAKERDKAAEYKQPPLQLPGAEKPAAAAKPADAKAAQAKADAARAAEAKAAEAKAAADAKATADAKAAAEAKALAAAKAAADTARAAAEAKAAAQPPALPPRAAPKEDRVIYPRPASDN